MSNTIRIKRRAAGGAAGAPTTLNNAELAFNEQDYTLYYGYGIASGTTASQVIAVAGSGSFLTLGTTQTVTGDKTFSGSVVYSGATSFADIAVNGGNITSSSTSFNLLNQPTSITLGSAATTIAIGALSGTTTIRNNASISGTFAVVGNSTHTGDIAINGGNLTSTASTFNLLAQPTTLNIGAAGTSITIGSSSGTTTIANSLTINGGTVNIGASASGTTTIRSATTSVSGTLDVTGDVSLIANLVVGGNLTVNGTLSTINSTTVTVDDKNIELGSTASPTDATADGGGITLKGTTDKTIIWDITNANWTSSENLNIATGKVFKINNVSVLSSTSLGSSVIGSSLTSVGTITTGTWSANTIAATVGGTGYNTYAIGDILYASATNALSKLSKGTGSQILMMNSGATAPIWSSTIDGITIDGGTF